MDIEIECLCSYHCSLFPGILFEQIELVLIDLGFTKSIDFVETGKKICLFKPCS